MIARVFRCMLLGALLSIEPVLADENADLDLIPGSARQPAGADALPSETYQTNQRIYFENAVSLSSLRGNVIVPFPPPEPARWQERAFLDERKAWKLGDRLNLTLSSRFNLRAEDHLKFPSHENLTVDFREGYVNWEPLDRTYLDIGRINLKNGVALGFNPTDFFKTRAVVVPLSADPSALREDRLGTLMLRVQRIWQGGTITVAFAPAFSRPSSVYTTSNLPSINPSFDRTNAHSRLLLKGSADIGNNLNPELLVYQESGRTKFGANVSRSFGQNVVAYAEWAGGERSSLIDEALRYGRDTGTLSTNASSVLPEDSRKHFQNDLSVGGSYTTETKITFNLEYHFHQAGFSRQDWNNWFNVGQGVTSSSPVARELWFIRSYALDQQEPLTRHSIFLRVDWVDAFTPGLEIIGFVNTDLYDGSSLIQIETNYYVSDAWTIGAQANTNLGSKRSNFGSLPQTASILFKVARYF